MGLIIDPFKIQIDAADPKYCRTERAREKATNKSLSLSPDVLMKLRDFENGF